MHIQENMSIAAIQKWEFGMLGDRPVSSKTIETQHLPLLADPKLGKFVAKKLVLTI